MNKYVVMGLIFMIFFIYILKRFSIKDSVLFLGSIYLTELGANENGKRLKLLFNIKNGAIISNFYFLFSSIS